MIKFLSSCFFGLILYSCSFNANTRNQGAQYLQGEWQQNSVDSSDLVEYKQHLFKFTCDSFYLILHNFSKADFYQDTCYKNGRWTEYVKGVYSLSGDTIVLKGAYVSPVFKLKKLPCYTTGGFDEKLLYQSYKDSALVLKSMITGNMVLKLKKRLACDSQTGE